MDYYIKHLPEKKSSAFKTLLKINLIILLLIFLVLIIGLFFYNPERENSDVLVRENTELKIKVFELEDELSELQNKNEEYEEIINQTYSEDEFSSEE